MKREISAQIVADSISPNGNRLTTFVLVFPRIVLAEFNTHRVFSRNSASSRAIPFEKMLESVKSDPFIPIKWIKEHTGMQGYEYFTEEDKIKQITDSWLETCDCAIDEAKNLNALGVTKQFVNRILEPFMWHTVIVTASDFENFFALRAHEAAEIHIQELAYKMLEEYNKSEAKPLNYGDWHIPFGINFDEERLEANLSEIRYVPQNTISGLDFFTHACLEIATARCARVSYLNFEGEDDYKKDIALFNRLSIMGHWSPFEHCAAALKPSDISGSNFRGWLQLRKLFNNENKQDERVEK